MSFTFPVASLVMSVAMGLGIGSTSAISRAIGAGDEGERRRLATHAIFLAVLVVAAISIVGIATQRGHFRLLGATDELLPLLESYMTIWYAGAAFLVVPMVGTGALRAGGDARTPMYVIYVDGYEVGHVPPAIHDALLDDGRAEHHRHRHEMSWVTHRLERPEDVEEAEWLLRLIAGLFRRGRITTDAQATDPLADVELSPRLRSAVDETLRLCASSKAV